MLTRIGCLLLAFMPWIFIIGGLGVWVNENPSTLNAIKTITSVYFCVLYAVCLVVFTVFSFSLLARVVRAMKTWEKK